MPDVRIVVTAVPAGVRHQDPPLQERAVRHESELLKMFALPFVVISSAVLVFRATPRDKKPTCNSILQFGTPAFIPVGATIAEYRKGRIINSPCFQIDYNDRNTGRSTTPFRDFVVSGEIRRRDGLSAYLSREPLLDRCTKPGFSCLTFKHTCRGVITELRYLSGGN